jgi:hypothetical protein
MSESHEAFRQDELAVNSQSLSNSESPLKVTWTATE